MSTSIHPVSEVQRTLEIEVEGSEESNIGALRFRLELHRTFAVPETYFARLYRIDRYSLLPWTTTETAGEQQLSADELVAVEDECLLSPEETASTDKVEPLRIALQLLENQFGADASACLDVFGLES